MPRELEEKLWDEARKKFPGDEERQRKYVYGTLNKKGLLHMTRGSKPKGNS